MKTIGIIAEFNPFHKGHEYLINEVRRLSGADSVVVVMSGDYVQRGECALWNKYTRTNMAVMSGVDLVLELPCVFATGSARDFAYGAVSLLDRLGVIDELWFGSEAGDMRLFDMVSDIFVDEPEEYSAILRSNLKSGMSFPAARAAAVVNFLHNNPLLTKKYNDKYLDLNRNDLNCDTFKNNNANIGKSNYDVLNISKVLNKISDFLNSPNNILGLEYCLALKKLKSGIVPRTLVRLGGGYNDETIKSKYSSASAIRKALLDGRFGDAFSALPTSFAAHFDVWSLLKKTLNVDDFSLILRYKLLGSSAESLAQYRDVNADLANRIKQLENEFKSFSQFAMLLKNKSTTYSHICRALIHIILEITDEDFEAAANADFIRILGINKANTALLSATKSNSKAMLCPKPADLKTGSYDKELFASNLYESVYASKFNTPYVHEYKKQLITR